MWQKTATGWTIKAGDVVWTIEPDEYSRTSLLIKRNGQLQMIRWSADAAKSYAESRIKRENGAGLNGSLAS